jgi:hypothetical protein
VTSAVKPPLDPFSEVVDERRRWNPEWYSWLTGVIKDISLSSGGGGDPTVPTNVILESPPWVNPLGLFDYNVTTFPFSAFPLGTPSVRWNIAGFSIIPIFLNFTAPGQLNWYLRSTPVYLWASAWNQVVASTVSGAEAASAAAIVTGVNVKADPGQPVEFHLASSGSVNAALFRIILWGKDE